MVVGLDLFGEVGDTEPSDQGHHCLEESEEETDPQDHAPYPALQDHPAHDRYREAVHG